MPEATFTKYTKFSRLNKALTSKRPQLSIIGKCSCVYRLGTSRKIKQSHNDATSKVLLSSCKNAIVTTWMPGATITTYTPCIQSSEYNFVANRGLHWGFVAMVNFYAITKSGNINKHAGLSKIFWTYLLSAKIRLFVSTSGPVVGR